MIIDLDGTIYRGDQLINHAKYFIGMLHQMDIHYKFFTNCSKHVPEELALTLRKMGLEVQASDIVTSGCITRKYMESMAMNTRVYAIGSASFQKYLRLDNIVELAEGTDIAADYVVVGFCTDFTYEDLSRALWHIQRGAKFIVTNMDETIPQGDNIVPHTGAIGAFLEYASKQKPFNLGKPSRYAGDFFRGIFGSGQILVVGDRIDTDMLFAKNNGFCGCLVLTGITTLMGLDHVNHSDYHVFIDLREFCKFLGQHLANHKQIPCRERFPDNGY